MTSISVDCFLDTNVLLYAATGTEAEAAKWARAHELIAARRFGISAQVLQEFYVNATRKVKRPMSPQDALAWMAQLDGIPCVATDAALVRRGAELSERYRISYWDGAIVAAAEVLGATTLYTEDLNPGQSYGAVRAVDPFAAA